MRWRIWRVRAMAATVTFALAGSGLAGMAAPAFAAGGLASTGSTVTASSCGGDGGNYGAELLGSTWQGGFTGVPVYSNGSSSAYDGGFGCQQSSPDFPLSPHARARPAPRSVD